MEQKKVGGDSNDTATMKIVVEHPEYSLTQAKRVLSFFGYKIVRKTYYTTHHRLDNYFKPLVRKPLLRTKGGVGCIDPYMKDHPFATIEEVAKHMEDCHFDMNAITVQRTLQRRYNFNTQINATIMNSGKYILKDEDAD